MKRVLVACEHSGVVRDAFTRAGCEAWSCDLLPCERPGRHLWGDIRDVIKYTPRYFDLLIGHPDCTYLSSSGLHWNKRRPERAAKTEAALEFFDWMLNLDVKQKALENPQGCVSTRIRPPDQYVHPYQFGDDASKKTGLWLEELPMLVPDPEDFVEPRWVCCGNVLGVARTPDLFECPACFGEQKPLPRWANQGDNGQSRLGPSADRWKIRSRTYDGIANAFAKFWAKA